MANVEIITGHLLTVGTAGSVHFTFFTNRNFVSNLGNPGDPGNAGPAGGPYEIGDQIPIESTFAGELGLGNGEACIRGQAYDRLYYTGTIELHGDPLVVPDSDREIIVVRGPFTLDGALRGFTGNPFVGDPGPAVFDYQLSGQGTAAVRLAKNDSNPSHLRYEFRFVSFDFGV